MSILVFDGDCAFCTRSAGFITRRIKPSTAVQWVGTSGEIRSGAAAITAMLKEAGVGWAALGTIGDLPGIRSVAAGTYRVIAKNRHRLPGSTAACDTSD